MSLYGVHKVCYLIETDMAFRKGLQDDPAKALQSMPLTDEEGAPSSRRTSQPCTGWACTRSFCRACHV